MAYYNFYGQAMPMSPWSSNAINGSKTASSGNDVLRGSNGDDNFTPMPPLR